MKINFNHIKTLTIKEVKELNKKLKGEIDAEEIKKLTASYPQFYK